MKRILVTGAGGSASYNFIKSLRDNSTDEKFYIVGADVSRYHIELSPVDKRYLLPRFNEKDYVEKLNEIIKKEKIDFIHLQPDGELEFFSKNRNKFNSAYFLPKHRTIELCQNKMEFNRIMKVKHVPVPEAFFINSEKDLESGFKKLIKNNDRLWLRAIKGAGSRAALPVNNINHAKMWIDYWDKMKGVGYGNFMLSEFLPGNEYAFQSIWKDGELIMSQARERIEYIFGNLTPSGQSSSPSVAKTVSNKNVNETAYKAIKAIDNKANGIFCVDLKTDKNGVVKVIEINAGRFFTTSYFFSKAGVNMPYYYIKLGLGKKISGSFKKFDNLEEDLYWVRMIDMSYKLIKKNKWKSLKV